MIHSENSRRQKKASPKENKEVAVFSYLVFFALFCAAILCGSLSFIILKNSEVKNFETHYESTTTQLKRSVQDLIQKYHFAADELAVIANMKYPLDSSWPNVSFQNFYLLDESITNVTGSTSSSSILPLVYPEQLSAFEEFAIPFLQSEQKVMEYPQVFSNIGVWQFGTVGYPHRDPFGETYFSTRHILVPILNPPLAIIQSGLVLGNLHALWQAGVAMDDCLQCVEEGYENCATMTDFLVGTQYESFASTSIYRPIFSWEPNSRINGTSKVLGFTTIGFDWAQELERLSFDILGIDCVLSSESASSWHTYRMRKGKAAYRGADDTHDKDFDSMQVIVPLSLLGSHTRGSASFVLEMYPTLEYRKSFHSNTPLYTSLGLVGMLIFTSAVFFSYDSLVKEDVREKDHILRMKRDFVRFISHEIRTPLNTVSVGMTLLEEGLQSLRLRQQETVAPLRQNSTDSVGAVSLDDRGEESNTRGSGAPSAGPGQDDADMSFAEMIELTGDVQSSTTVAVSVLNDLLNFDKLEAGEVQIAHEIVPLWDVVSTVVKNFKIQAYQKKINLNLTFERGGICIPPELIEVDGDKFKLAHVIRNMISNALKFTENQGSIAVKVRLVSSTETDGLLEQGGVTSPGRLRGCCVRFSRSGVPSSDPPSASEQESVNTVEVSVKDSGYGLTEDQVSQLFKDGVQFDPNKLQAGQGSGLGLYLSSKIMEVHGGRMWAESDGPSLGATFFMKMPLKTNFDPSNWKFSEISADDSVHSFGADNPAVNSSRSPAIPVRDPLPLEAEHVSERVVVRPPGRVLVVDDTTSNRKIVCRVLRSRGFECVEAKDGQECVNLVKRDFNSDHFSCILMDFEMPILNGPDATLALRDMGFKKPIYGLTGNVMPDDVQYFLDSGATCVLAKPLDVAEFMNLYNGVGTV